MGTGRLIVKTCRKGLPRPRHLRRLQRAGLRPGSSRWEHSLAMDNPQRWKLRDTASRWRPVAGVFRRLFVGLARRGWVMPMEPTVQGRRHGNSLLGQSPIRLRKPNDGSHGGPGRNRRGGRTEAAIVVRFQHRQHVVILTVPRNDSPSRSGLFRIKRPAPNRRPSATDAHHRIFSGKNSRMRSS